MNTQQDSLRILRRTGEQPDGAIDLAEAALALSGLERPNVDLAPYRLHIATLVAQLRAHGKEATTLAPQLQSLRQVLVLQNKYCAEEAHLDDARATNFMDVLDRRRGGPLLLGLLYLHLASSMGWAMTGIDLSGHFFLRLSARDGQMIIDPFRAGQPCQIEEAGDALLDDDGLILGQEREKPTLLDLTSELLHPISSRELLLRLQHAVKRRLLSQDRIDAGITTLQGMILFAPRHQDLWKELGYLQAERGHIRAAITALEVVRDLAADPAPLQQADGILRELRWRLN